MRPKQQRGKFITFEGLDGVGKSTQLGKLAEHLRRRGIEVITTREPGGTTLGDKLRAVLLHSRTAGLSPLAELALMFVDRAQHIDEQILPALAKGQWVLCDRFTDSSEAYQGGGRELGSGLGPLRLSLGNPAFRSCQGRLRQVKQRLLGFIDRDSHSGSVRHFDSAIGKAHRLGNQIILVIDTGDLPLLRLRRRRQRAGTGNRDREQASDIFNTVPIPHGRPLLWFVTGRCRGLASAQA